MIVSFKTSNADEVCELLNGFQKNGWNIKNMYVDITHGPGGYTVFYDERLATDPRK